MSEHPDVSKLAILFISFLLVLVINGGCFARRNTVNSIKWNSKSIQWNKYKEGMAKARKEKKPAIIVFYSDSCSTCKKYKKVFYEKRVIDASSSFVMILVNTGKNSKLSRNYTFDGRYVPRTFAVYPNGKVMHQLYRSKKYKYFIGLTPGDLLGLMRKAHLQMPKKH